MYNNQELNYLKTIKELVEEETKFIVPAYQRGYRWTKINVLQLIEDIFGDLENEYCLQPLIVYENDSGFNVIDGQQRLTTILIFIGGLKYLIERSIEKKISVSYFSLEYETRKGSKLFLEFLLSLSSETIDLNWKEIWKAFYDKYTDENLKENLDFRYMFQSFVIIKEKLEEIKQNKNVDYSDLCNHLLNKCEFIWYPLNSNDISDSLEIEEKQFYKVNMGKISLTNSELIKSEFMSPQYYKDIDADDINIALLAEKWYQIEMELRNPDFWVFIPHENQYGVWDKNKKAFLERNDCVPRIEEIFQLFLLKIFKKNNKSYREELEKEGYPKFFIYNNIKKWIEEKGDDPITKKWYEIEELFLNIQELYNNDGRNTAYQNFYEQNLETKTENYKNDSLYNLIGYTIYTLAIVLEQSEYEIGEIILDILEKNRDDRKKYLKKLIRENFCNIFSIESDKLIKVQELEEKLEEIEYTENEKTENDVVDEREDKNKKLKNILLLFNIILLDKNPGISSRYDFLKYRYWTVEHIFAQNEKNLCSEVNEINKLKSELKKIEDEFKIYISELEKKNRKNIEKCKSEEDKNKIIIAEDKKKLEKQEQFDKKKKEKENKIRKLMDSKKVFLVRKEIIENLLEYYDNMKEEDEYLNNDKLKKQDRVKLVYNLMSHIEKLDTFKENDMWENMIEEDIVDKWKEKVLKLMCEGSYKYKSIEELFNEVVVNEKKVDVFTEKIQEMYGLEELTLYTDFISSYSGVLSEVDFDNNQSNNIAKENGTKIIKIIEKAVLQKFKIKNCEKNRKILKIIYENEIDEYFEGNRNSETDYNSLLMDNSLHNLTLLRSVENRKLANEYIGKKEKIHEYINSGTVIPYSTLLVFTDRYTDLRKENNGERWQWLPSSRDKYFEDLLNTIYKFFVEEE